MIGVSMMILENCDILKVFPALTFGQEFELVWVSRVPHHKNKINSQQRQHWSLMTVLYLSVFSSCYDRGWQDVLMLKVS